MPCNNACLMGDICCKRYGGSRKPPCASQPEELSTTALHTGGPKLPEWENLWAALPPAPADWGCDIPTAVEIYRYGAQSAYDFICRQLRARV